MNKLIWELFEMIRELLPPTQENTKRLAEWAQRFQTEQTGWAAHDPEKNPTASSSSSTPPDHEKLDPEHELELEELENEGGHSHIEIEHTRGAPPRRKKKK